LTHEQQKQPQKLFSGAENLFDCVQLPPVLILNDLRLGDHRRIHSTILRPPPVGIRVAHAMCTTQLGHGHAAVSLTQDREDPGSVYLLVFIWNLLTHLGRKFYLCRPSLSGGLPLRIARREKMGKGHRSIYPIGKRRAIMDESHVPKANQQPSHTDIFSL
jgi:hypothetical protein